MPQAKLNIESKGQGIDIVMLHGWGMNHAVFSPLFEKLSNYRVHYVDLPGFGHSDAIDGELEAWCQHLIEQLPDNSIWLGWSLGGLIASKIALLYPTKVKALITVASSPCFLAKPE